MASVGGWSRGVFRRRKSGPSWPTGNEVPSISKRIFTSAEWPVRPTEARMEGRGEVMMKIVVEMNFSRERAQRKGEICVWTFGSFDLFEFPRLRD